MNQKLGPQIEPQQFTLIRAAEVMIWKFSPRIRPQLFTLSRARVVNWS